MTCTKLDYEKIEPDFGRYDFALFMRIAEYYVQSMHMEIFLQKKTEDDLNCFRIQNSFILGFWVRKIGLKYNY
jgi:hypothetical protein